MVPLPTEEKTEEDMLIDRLRERKIRQKEGLEEAQARPVNLHYRNYDLNAGLA